MPPGRGPPGHGPGGGGPMGCFGFLGDCMSRCLYFLCCCCIFQRCCGPIFGGRHGGPGGPHGGGPHGGGPGGPGRF